MSGPQLNAVERYSDRQLQQRIQMNQAARFGLETASSAQLNVIFVLAKRWKLDPVTDITLFEGHPWITAEGHFRLLRRHPDYRGIDSYPLSAEEKQLWGYEAADVVIETAITTANWGVIKARGRVARAEIDDAMVRAERSGKRAAPVGTHPVEIAEKRSIARAQRLAFGQDVPDFDEIEQEMAAEIQMRNDPVKTAHDAATYRRIFGADEDDVDDAATPQLEAGEVADEVTDEDDPPAA